MEPTTTVPSKVEIYTDGACRGNPGPGGWGALLRHNNTEKTILGSEAHTTNNRMEMLAVISALASLKRPCVVDITTDSQYVMRGMTEWSIKWKQHGWRKRKNDKELIKNADLWQRLDEEVSRHQVTWHWVRGHTGHPENTLADELANQAIDALLAQ